uniref:General transcription factor 3C polypeptide 1 n=1 Tax=Angiostrongylus cantonensis TaxID=6313 RepID=A0A0K0CWH7_ANGCA
LDLLDVVNTATAKTNFGINGGTAYLSYNESTWSPLFLYRLPADIALTTIRDHGTEGIGRVEIGWKMGLDTSAKAGNRRVSSYILTACNEHPQHIGQFQKMEGKIRCIKYFWKADKEPEQFKKLFDDFEKFAGRPCPFKLGQVIKFPNCNLSTLRISDVTLRRLNDILELVANKRVIVTIHKITRFISKREQSYGYDFTIDKKSLLKCLKALESARLLTVFETNVAAESVETKVFHIDIRSSLVKYISLYGEEYQENFVRSIAFTLFRSKLCAIPKYFLLTIQKFCMQYRQPLTNTTKKAACFLMGSCGMFSMKRRAEMEGQPALLDPIENIEKECTSGIDLSRRYNLLRFQISRSAVTPLKKPENSETSDKDDLTWLKKNCDGDVTTPSNGDNKSGEPGMSCSVNRINEKISDFNEAVLSTSPVDSNSKAGPDTEPVTEFGYQSKAIRCFVVHEIAFQLVFGHPEGTKPNCYDLSSWIVNWKNEDIIFSFPPGESFSSWAIRDVDKLTVFVDEESPLRFLPHLPPFTDVQRGWFMVQDFLAALPLSAFVLVAHVSKKIDVRVSLYCINFMKNMLQSYLSDPIKRHICIGCLPNEIRMPILKDKKVVRQLEHIMLTNCALGLMAIAPNPDVKRFSSPRASVFYVSRKAVLYDTSTSGKGYASVTLPLSSYDKYNYEFNAVDDLVLYWHHLRAIVQSTPLSFRNDANAEEINLARHKKYTMGQFDKSLVTRDPSDKVDQITPLGPREGCAGFDSALYMQLIMIRAVGFFLNPVYRFWLDPSVVRDIMHEYMPESRCKTVQCLMAAAVREMVRPARLAYLQRIVRSLSTFQEMRDLRFLLASSPLSTAESKASFFKNAFDVANRLLFMESQVLPVAATSDKQFESFLNSTRLAISTEQSVAAPIPLRSRVPTTLAHIHHCVAVNLLLSILIHYTDGAFSESILDQISASVLCNALQVLRSDGLVSRSRVLDQQLMVITKNQAILSYYFRHFFTHRFHPDIVEQAVVTFDTLDDSVEGMEELQGDLCGVLVAAASAFYNNSGLEISVDEEVFTMFEQAVIDQATQSIKQIRYLENTNLHLEQIHIFGSSCFEQSDFPSWQSILPKIDWSQSASDFPPPPFEEFLLDVPVSRRKDLRSVYNPIVSASEYGATLSDIQVTSVGVDVQRWVSADFALAWCVKVGGRIVSPRPWTMPSGEICPATVRWMAESILMMIVSSPGITLKEVCFRFEFVLQPIAVQDLVTVLEAAGCVNLVEEVFENITLSSLFQGEYTAFKDV